MPKGKSYKKYSGEFKVKVIEQMQAERLSYREAARLFEISDHDRVRKWEHIYLEEGPAGLAIGRRGRRTKGDPERPPKLDKKVEGDLIAEVQQLRMENDYLKKLNTLVQQRQLREKTPR